MASIRAQIAGLTQIVRDTPKAFRARMQVNGVMATLKAVPEMARFAVHHYLIPKPSVTCTYDQWLRRRQWTAGKREELLARLNACSGVLPKISVVMPVYNTPVKWLNRAIESVREQAYQNWELCIADDASPSPEIRPVLEKWAKLDPRIKVTYRQKNGHISLATNSAAELATGEFIALLDHDDEIPADCLGEIALKLAETPDADLLYTDDDKIDEQGKRYDPQFKGGFAPEMLLSFMYFCHMMVLRRSLYEQVGGMRVGYEGSQDHDLALRISEHARKVVHLPQVLYHWRAIQGSTALGSEQKTGTFEATRRSIQDALDRRAMRATAVRSPYAVAHNVGDCMCEFPDEGPSVALIIPTRNGLKLLRMCIESLAQTTYKNYRIVVIDNDSDDPATLDYLRKAPCEVLRISSPGGKFSFAHLNNRAVERVSDEYVLLLNNDTEVIEPKWLSRMMGYAQLKGVGSVGARLLFPDGRVQHAGIAHSGSPVRVPWHLFKFFPNSMPGYMRMCMATRSVAAVTAACMVTPRELYLRVGGLDEQRFRVAFNDVDYGYRLVEAGYRNIYCASAVLRHHESVSRGYSDDPQEHMNVKELYGKWRDPFISPHFTVVDHDLQLAAD